MRLLVKANPAATQARLGVGAGPAQMLSPLMPSIDAARAEPLAWHVSAPVDPRANPWDLCHGLLRQGLGFAGGEVALAEPDLEQHWLPPAAQRLGLGLRGSDCSVLMPQSDNYPKGPADGWFADAGHSGLAEARAALGRGAPAVRIAHLDTGYDPNHHTKPARLREDLALNFADPLPDGRPAPGAEDQKTAEVNPMFGHGTATLALLAGEVVRRRPRLRGRAAPRRQLGGAVPQQRIAAALDHVLAPVGRPGDALRRAEHEHGRPRLGRLGRCGQRAVRAGIVLVTAAGNNYGNLPTRSIVYPARFNRVLAACGIMADGRPYADLPLNLMAGCYGPRRKMRTALPAWTPNVPWAKFGCPDAVDMDGGGTSAATPQVAAAAALWLQRNKAALAGHAGWKRVEAVRQALFATAAGAGGDAGRISAAACCGPRRRWAARRRRSPRCARKRWTRSDFAVLRLLAGLGVAPELAPAPAQRMLELEALQLSQRSPRSARRWATATRPRATRAVPAGGGRCWPWRPIPACSEALRGFIRGHLAPPQVPRTALPAPPPRSPAQPAGPRPTRPAGPASAEAALPQAAGLRLRSRGGQPDAEPRHRHHDDPRWTGRPGPARPGPRGEYLEVSTSIRQPARLCAGRPQPAGDPGAGRLEPQRRPPQFHQQMVYAVAMKTIGHFERGARPRAALGRPRGAAAGRHTTTAASSAGCASTRTRCASRTPITARTRHALLFGYFRAARPDGGTVTAGRHGLHLPVARHRRA